MAPSVQGSHFISADWQRVLKVNQLEGSMSRRGNCHDNALAESFLQLLKRIEQLTGHSLQDPYVRLNLQNALLMEQILFHHHTIDSPNRQ